MMKAIVKYNKGDSFTELREVTRPVIDSEEVLIEVKAAGICGTDIHIIHDEFKYSAPVTMGHEFSGEIVEVGEKVKEWKVGERVVSEPHTGACRVCRLCRTGNPQICSKKRPIGSGTDGAFAEYVKVPSWLLHRIPEEVSFEEAALTEPVAICVHCILEKTGIEAGDFIATLGPGPIGLLAAQVVKSAGASCVLISGISRDTKTRQ
jgi:threonine dehydrogenase-like Zn-dependent dehydrogenase